MRVLITGSSGQIGTNLALRLVAEGHDVFGVDKRLNDWTDDFRYLLQDLSGHYAAMEGGIGGVAVPTRGCRRAPRRAREGAPAGAQAAPGPREHDDDVQRARVLPADAAYRSSSAPSREVYGDVHRYSDRGAARPTSPTRRARTPPPRSPARPLSTRTRAATGCRYIVFRFSNVYGRFDNDLARMVRVIPLFIHRITHDQPITVFGGNDKVLDFTYVDDCVDGIMRGISALAEGRVRNETVNLAYGEGNTLVRVAELIGEATGKEPDIDAGPAAARRGDALRRRHRQGANAARLGAGRPARRGASRAASPGTRSGERRTPGDSASNSTTTRLRPRRRPATSSGREASAFPVRTLRPCPDPASASSAPPVPSER